jgi:glycosyltransferase involved in cell wall biosynthesis
MLSEIMNHKIHWKPLRFTKGLGFMGKLWDFTRMYFWSFYLANKYTTQVVHARGHAPAQVGLFLKQLLGKKLIFDFRGLWVDERIDKGRWDLNNFFHRLQYKYFKQVEKKLLSQADQIVVLTDKVVNEVVKLGVSNISKVTTIPCCADFDHFILSNETLKLKARALVNISKNSFVVGYLGSVGNMYLLDRFFYLFKQIANARSDCCALLITYDVLKLKTLVKSNLPDSLHNSVYIKSASREGVPLLITAMDIMVSFILPSYARMGASPTKIAECFAAGVPVIANDGVGDIAKIVNKLDGGKIVDPFSDEDLTKVPHELDKIVAKGGYRLREVSRPILGLELANKRYKSVYEKII